MNNQTPNPKLLQVKIISPRQIVFEGPALSVSSKNSCGKFDILPEHANFISLIQKEPIIIQTSGKDSKTYQFDMAVIYTSLDKVNIFTDLQLAFNPNS